MRCVLCVPCPLQDSSGMRLWKRKWFVLSDYCLFYYKGESMRSALDHSYTGNTVMDPQWSSLWEDAFPDSWRCVIRHVTYPAISHSSSYLSYLSNLHISLWGVIFACVAIASTPLSPLITLNNGWATCPLTPHAATWPHPHSSHPWIIPH